MIDRPRRTALFTVVAAVAGLAGAYATAGWTPAFVALPIDGLIVSLTPAVLVNFMIENVGEEAHYLHQAGAVTIAGGLFAAAAVAGIVAGRRVDNAPAGAALAGLLAGGVTVGIAGAAVPAVTAGASVTAVVLVGVSATDRSDGNYDGTDDDRRAAIGAVAGGAAYAGLSLVLGSRATRNSQAVSDGLDLGADDAEVAAMLQQARETDLGIDGVQPPVSEYGDFYQIDINSAPPQVDAEDWSLTVRGAVESEVEVDFEELRARETEHRFLALRCIGESLNGDKLDTALWTGTPLASVLEEAVPRSEYVELHSADGYVSTFPREFLAGGLIAYGMNGETLPREHGHPARILMPGTWGKVNNKWVTDVVFVEEDTDGYWEERGWNSEARIKAVAKLWTGSDDDPVNRLDDGRLEVGGHAYAGTRGVERVEVSTDGGETWDEAELADPLPGEDVTRQWRYRYEADDPHEVVARVVDGEGTVQTAERTDSFPDGATGWVRATVEP